MGMKAYVFIKAETGKAYELLAALKALPAVRHAKVCFGRPDIICSVEASDDRALGSLVLQDIQVLPGVLETDTHIVIED
ncbi:MAG: Lrp/AsnC ligand binding domain-containing protein [Nitrospiraceae bacterium]